MAVITTAEVSDLQGLSSGDTAQLDRVSVLIPFVERDIADYCNHWFADEIIYRESGGELEFVRGAPDTITDSASEFSTAGLISGDQVVVQGSESNDGIHTATTVAAGTLTLSSTDELRSYDQDDNYRSAGPIRISRVDWPKALKPVAAKMVMYHIDSPREDDARAQVIDDYSVTYAGANAYPERVTSALDRFKRPRFG